MGVCTVPLGRWFAPNIFPTRIIPQCGYVHNSIRRLTQNVRDFPKFNWAVQCPKNNSPSQLTLEPTVIGSCLSNSQTQVAQTSRRHTTKSRIPAKWMRPHLEDEADDGGPSLEETGDLEPVLLQRVVPPAQVEAEPALRREIHHPAPQRHHDRSRSRQIGRGGRQQISPKKNPSLSFLPSQSHPASR